MATDSVTVSPTYNGDSVSLTAGMIVRLKPGANNNVVMAQADSAPHIQGVNGVVVSGAASPGGVLTVGCIGRASVQLESGLVPAVGDTVYVSASAPGKGTNVQPGVIATIGSIADISNYVASGTVEVDVAIGDQGTAGAAGPQGAPGAQGSQGSSGAQGAQGTAGAQGATGLQGSSGAQGAQGTAGAQGPQGATGTQGTQGFQGSTGVQGPSAGFATPGTLGPTLPTAGVATTAMRSDALPGQPFSATWPIANARWYAVDAVNGNDNNIGFSDVSETDAGTKAKATIAGLAAIVPRLWNGRRGEIVIANGGVNTAQSYSDGLDALIGGITGALLTVKATGTNANAGATAFGGNAASDLYCGAVTVTGLNAAGYNPTGAPTTTVIQCVKNGGGAPGFAAEPAAPLEWRIRFDTATATVALRGICKTITKVAGTDTLTVATALSTAPAAGDVFYIEQAGVVLSNAFHTVNLAGSQVTVAGLDLTGSIQLVGSTVWQIALSRFAAYLPGDGVQVSVNRIVPFFGRNTNVAVGGGLIIIGGTTGSLGSFYLNMETGLVQTTQLQLIAAAASNIGNSAVLGLGAYIDGGSFSTDSTDQLFGGTTTALRVLGAATSAGLGAGIGIAGTRLSLGLIDLQNCGARAAIAARGACVVNFAKLVSGSTGNTDVGLDLTLSKGSTIVLTTTPTVTGTVGDVRLSDGTIISWATAAAGVTDPAGNVIQGPATSPLHPILVAPGAGTLAVTNAPAGATAYARYFKFPDGAGGFFTVGSLT